MNQQITLNQEKVTAQGLDKQTLVWTDTSVIEDLCKSPLQEL